MAQIISKIYHLEEEYLNNLNQKILRIICVLSASMLLFNIRFHFPFSHPNVQMYASYCKLHKLWYANRFCAIHTIISQGKLQFIK